MTAPRNKRRLHRTRLGRIAEAIMSPSLRARGFTHHRLIAAWEEIAGPAAGWSEPQAITFPRGQTTAGSLTVNVASGRGPEMQMLADGIITRCNAVFGYPAIGRITITQKAMRAAAAPPPAKTIPKHEPDLAVSKNAILSEDLRRIFDTFGKSPARKTGKT